VTGPIENVAGKSEAEIRAFLRDLDDGGLLAQEVTQKGAMHAVRFILESEGDARELAEQMRESLRWHAMIISEECARRGLPVVAENG
jgi:hypothetical protein